MGFEYTRTVTTTATPNAVWAIWSDPGSWYSWDPAVESVAMEGHFGEGAGGTMVLTGGIEVPVMLEVVEPGARYLDRLEMGDLRSASTTSWRVVGGAEVTVSTVITGPGAEDIGPMVTADSPKAMAALVAMAEGR